MLRRIFDTFSARAQARRAAILATYIRPAPEWRILDLGGGTGEHINRIFPKHRDITVCDYSADALTTARERYGYRTIRADASNGLPFAEGEFDLVFCSSVIEHVTGPKEQVLNLSDGPAFRERAFHFQKKFASEIRRVGKCYYIQTPHRYFMVESHTWLPLPIVLLPRPVQIAMIKFFNAFWPKRTKPDWNLLVPSQIKELFPDAEIVVETFAGWPKSIMAIKR